MNQTLFESSDIIFCYTRENAIDDGFLVDVTEEASETGFVIPVAISRAAWEDCVAWEKEDEDRKPYRNLQDESGRLHDVLWLAFLAAKNGAGDSIRYFRFNRIPRQGKGVKARLTTLKLHIGPGDQGEPVITIMLPDED